MKPYRIEYTESELSGPPGPLQTRTVIARSAPEAVWLLVDSQAEKHLVTAVLGVREVRANGRVVLSA